MNAEFELESLRQWLKAPETRSFFRALEMMAAGRKELWVEASWDGSENDQALADVRRVLIAQAAVLIEITTLNAEEIMAVLAPPQEGESASG